MDDTEYWTAVQALRAFHIGIRESTIRSALRFFGSIRPVKKPEALDWSPHLMAASLVTLGAPETLQDGALRIAQGCLQDPDADSDRKDAASYLLERLGNERASSLARSRGLSPERELPLGPLALDLFKRNLQLSVAVGDKRVRVNEFQRQFWDSANSSKWMSVSAPTSAGKSHIVRVWLEALIESRDDFHAAYIVPTRALIEEVSRELESTLGTRATITTLPWGSRIGTRPHEIFVLTQERLHLLLRQKQDLNFDLIFVDEAQKLADGMRGVLLQRALDEATLRGDPQVVFASPLTSNPELLVDGTDGSRTALLSETVTVNQTLLHVNQRPRQPTLWDMRAFIDGQAVPVGEFDLPARPVPESKRLALVAVALGRSHSGNVVYANRPSDAEKTAGQIADALNDHWAPDQSVLDVIDLIKKTIHPQFLLAAYLLRGVAFHYGNLPLLIREAVERLFRDGAIRYLVCTSTLLEGVNLPCQNLFVREPRKGNNTPMSPSDFWNLAGRAGRWGVEFQGNVICVDTDRAGWTQTPIRRERQHISRATDAVEREFVPLLEYIGTETAVSDTTANPLLQSLFGILASTRRRSQSISSLSWLSLTEQEAEAADRIVDDALAKVHLPPDLQQMHAGISPFALQRLFDYFVQSGERETFELPPPESDDALDSYRRAISLCAEYLGADFTNIPGRHFSLALLFIDWMRGRPLSLLVSKRLGWLRRNNREIRLPQEIRQVLTDVEQYARFEGPLYLACYADVLNAAFPAAQDAPAPPDIAMLMELGVSRTTEVSMMGLGLSRTTVVSLAEHVVPDDLDIEACVVWLREHDFDALGFPALVSAEIKAALMRAELRQT